MKKLHCLLIALATLGPVSLAQAQATVETKVAMCIGCHGIPGYQASFPEIHKVPKISGQSAKYIESALVAYKKGERKHPTMRGIAASMSEQDMAEVAAYYEKQSRAAAAPTGVAAPSTEVAELLKKGNCVACHGENMSKPIDPSYPKLAGQHADYLYVALKSYQVEKNPNVGRANAIMGGMAKPFTLKELKVLSTYIASLPGELQTVPQSPLR